MNRTKPKCTNCGAEIKQQGLCEPCLEIRREAAKIREEWSERDYWMRSGKPNRGAEVPVVKDPGMQEAVGGY